MDYATKFIGKSVEVTIDRPKGSKHPKYKFSYPINYGYVSGTVAPDGKEIDAYVIGITKSVSSFFGKCIAVIHRNDDEDDKLVVIPSGTEITNNERNPVHG